jgi:hypothetical protein
MNENRLTVEPAQKRGYMFSFFKNRRENTSDDVRAAQFILLFQIVIEKNVFNSETKELRKFYKEMKYPEFMNHQDVAIDYIYFLLHDRRDFPWSKNESLGMEKKEAIIGSFQSAVQRGLIIIEVDSIHFTLMQEVAEVN